MLSVHRGDPAEQLLATPAFQSRWQTLCAACPWGTVFQDVPFVTTWYACYRDEFEPLVVCDTAADGALLGLLCLAVSRATGEIVPCGTSQSEYDVWLAPPARGVAFIEAACAALAGPFPHGRLEFLFLPPHAPQDFTAAWRGRRFVRMFPRPLHRTTPGSDDAQASLKKKGNRSKLNQIQRLGGFSFQRITTPAEFDAFLEEMIPLFDARQTILNGVPPFGADPHRRRFFTEMFRQGILHVTAMRVGGRLGAAHIGHINRGQVVLGLIAHSPFLSKYSVGKFQLLLLAVELQKEGFEAFDLTPGGDYKNRFATHGDEAHVLTIFFSSRDALMYRAKRRVIDAGKAYLSTDRVKTAIARIGHRVRLLRASEIPRTIVTWLATPWARRDVLAYRIEASAIATRPPTAPMSRDAFADLLRYAPVAAAQPMAADFLRIALERLGDGCHVYTRVTDGRLVQWGWLADPRDEIEIAEVGQPLALPPGSVVIFDVASSPDSRARARDVETLGHILADAVRAPGVIEVVIVVPASDRALREAIVQLGFRDWRTVRRRRAAPAPPPTPSSPADVTPPTAPASRPESPPADDRVRKA